MVSNERLEDFTHMPHHAQEHEVKQIARELLAARERERWIPVSERLPEDAKDVLVLAHWERKDNRGIVDSLAHVAWLDGDGYWYINSQTMLRRDAVTHWRPLPPSPEAR
jgi:hypothetical protein